LKAAVISPALRRKKRRNEKMSIRSEQTAIATFAAGVIMITSDYLKTNVSVGQFGAIMLAISGFYIISGKMILARPAEGEKE
jgi:hypothetical protein